MNMGRASYQLNINCDGAVVNQVIQSFLAANNFKLVTKHGESYYRYSNMFEGESCFKYNISQGVVMIEAWKRNGFGGEISLNQNGIGNINTAIISYREKIGTLLAAIDKLNNNASMNNGYNQTQGNNQMNFDPNTGQPLNNNYASSSNQAVLQNFNNSNNKSLNKTAKWGLFYAIIGLITSLTGGMDYFSALFAIIGITCGIRGLKSESKGLAIADIVLSVLSIVCCLLEIGI